MNVLVTGALGNVGKSTVEALISRGDRVTIFEADRPRCRRLAKRLGERGWKSCRAAFGDIRDANALAAALDQDTDAICHLAAVIPPATNHRPGLAESVNSGGTAALVAACDKTGIKPRILLASSIATYGDRIRDYWIRVGDPAAPDDEYGLSKVECERIVRDSGLPWTIFRLTYVVSAGLIKPDPILFDMPVATKIEVCHTKDVGRAFAAAVHEPEAAGRILDIGGGALCRTAFRPYLDRMFRIFGLGGSDFLPDDAFATGESHCGWYADSDEAEELLHFRSKSLEDYYDEVRWKTRLMRFFAPLAAPFVKARLLASSPHRGV